MADINVETGPFQEDRTQGLGALVAAGERVMAVENDTLRSIATQRPRNEEQALNKALKELEIVPELAANNYYVIPFKDGDRTVNVEGPSIKAAMSLARHWGNCTDGARMAGEDDDRVVVEGVFVDLETGRRTARQVSVPRTRWDKRRRQMVSMRGDKMNQAVQAGMSKAVRNAVLAALPEWLVTTYYEAAKEIASSGRKRGEKEAAPLQKRIERVTTAFTNVGVTPELLTSYLGHPLEETTAAEIADLIGIGNAIRDRQTTVEEVFGGADKEKDNTPPASKAADALKVEDIAPEKGSKPLPADERGEIGDEQDVFTKGGAS